VFGDEIQADSCIGLDQCCFGGRDEWHFEFSFGLLVYKTPGLLTVFTAGDLSESLGCSLKLKFCMDGQPEYLHILDNVFCTIDGAFHAFMLWTALRVYTMLLHGLLIVLDDRRHFMGIVLFACLCGIIIWKVMKLPSIGHFSEEYVNNYLRPNLRNP
jgi:hypothetical protein